MDQEYASESEEQEPTQHEIQPMESIVIPVAKSANRKSIRVRRVSSLKMSVVDSGEEESKAAEDYGKVFSNTVSITPLDMENILSLSTAAMAESGAEDGNENGDYDAAYDIQEYEDENISHQSESVKDQFTHRGKRKFTEIKQEQQNISPVSITVITSQKAQKFGQIDVKASKRNLGKLVEIVTEHQILYRNHFQRFARSYVIAVFHSQEKTI